MFVDFLVPSWMLPHCSHTQLEQHKSNRSRLTYVCISQIWSQIIKEFVLKENALEQGEHLSLFSLPADHY